MSQQDSDTLNYPDLFGNLIRAGQQAVRGVAASPEARELLSLATEGGHLAEEQIAEALRRLGVPTAEEFAALRLEVASLREQVGLLQPNSAEDPEST